MNRLFKDISRGSVSPELFTDGLWPHIEVEDTSSEYRVTAELPCVEENDVGILIYADVLILRGEKHVKTESRGHGSSGRVYGRFERRIALDGANEAKWRSESHSGLLTIIVPKSAQSRERVTWIPINHATTTH